MVGKNLKRMEQKNLVINNLNYNKMKKIILTSTLILSIVSCRAQVITPIFGSYDRPDSNPIIIIKM